MIHPLPGMSQRDIAQWFDRGVVLATLSPGSEPVPALFITALEDTSVAVDPLLGDSSGRRHVLPYTSIAGYWPLCGSVNLNEWNIAVHVKRLTTKQFRRTLNMSCIEVTTPRLWEVSRFLGTRRGSAPPSLTLIGRALYLEQYHNFAEACRMIDSGEWFSVAVTRHVIVAGDPSGKRMFYYDGEPVATAYGGELYPLGDGDLINRIHKATGGVYRGTQCY